ncbi:MAG: hypothetical protein JRH08_16140 [Deltaproteobacteria bacterium]|nr:hypothetical protein [Deltaproteobacteria bacterium]MBW1929183.1 hypothetical protein [Deltaproteobacteria bacterium]MBW2127155.1 hypothetical protein [Deltaproteobacteria bacterium]
MRILEFVICVDNSKYPASLEKWKIYPLVGKEEALGLIRVVDESGEDYLYPEELFAGIQLPSVAREKIRKEYHKKGY